MTTPAPSDPRANRRATTTFGGRASARRRRRLVPLAVVAPAAMALAVVVPAHLGAAVTVAPPATPVPAAAAPVAASPVDVATHQPTTSHTVVLGETLSGIAVRYGTTVSALVAANDLSDPNLIMPRTDLAVPRAGADPTAALPARLQESPDRLAYRPSFDRWADANGVPVDLLEAMTWLESGWQVGRVSPDGAIGIGQLMPGTVEHMELLIGVDLDPYLAEDNIRMSARYLRWLLQRTDGVGDALAGYYQGLASVQHNGRFDDTEAYVDNILALRERF